MRLRFLSAGLLTAAAATAAGCGQTTIIKTVSTTPAAKPPASQSAAPNASDAHLGDLLTVDARETTLKIRANQVIDPLPTGDYDTPDAGKRYVGVEIAVKNVGDQPYADSVSNGSTLIL